MADIDVREDLGPRGLGKTNGRHMIVVDGIRRKPDYVAPATKARTIGSLDDFEREPVVTVTEPSDPDGQVPAPSDGGEAPLTLETIKELEYDDLKKRVEDAEIETPDRKKKTLVAALAAHLGLA